VADPGNTDSWQSDEDAVWRDLVARYDVPLTAEEPAPWPEREGDTATEVPGTPGVEVDRVPGAGSDAGPGPHEPQVMPAPRLVRGARDPGGSTGRDLPAASTGRDLPAAADDDDEHFIPPPPPPLPKLDPVAKGAWVALFGGPGYLVVATAAGWTVSGFAAFCAVAAFVAGFAILVLRMHEPGPGGPDDGDDGAVV
jgi:hypothetical protein